MIVAKLISTLISTLIQVLLVAINPAFTRDIVIVHNLIQSDADINDDGVVNIIDVLLASRAVLVMKSLTSNQLQHAAATPLTAGVPAPDGIFNTADFLLINRKALREVIF